MLDYRSIFEALVLDPRYAANLDWGEAREGHPEGTIRAHIAEIEGNLDALRSRLSEQDYWKLKLVVHAHDSFKADAKAGVAISHPMSHASLGRKFLAEYCSDSDLLNIVQYHDEPLALYRQFETKGSYNQERFNSLVATIKDWNLFLAFHIIDGCTEGKSREPLRWFFSETAGRVASSFTAADIIG